MVLCAEPPPKLKIPESKIKELTDDTNHDSPKLERRTRMHHIERHGSCVVTLSDMELDDLQPRLLLQTLEVSRSPGGGSQCSLHEETPTDTNASHRHAIADAAWEALKRSVVYFRGQPIGTVAAIDKSQGAALNYDQVFMRDFIPSALAFLMKGEHLIVKNFLVETARLQLREKMVDLFKLGQGVMPASFKVHHCNSTQKTESLLADFGETAIGRVAPVDSGLWWIILLRAYTKWTGDNSLAESPNCQRAMDLILRLCLSEGCDTSPALLCADGCSMIDRRMGIYGYPIEIQALFFMAMRCALSMLKQDSDPDFVNHITKRIQALSYHLHSYYWLDYQRLNDIYRYKIEEYSQTALNKFNVIPESIPDWIILLCAYTKWTGDNSLAESPNFQRAMDLILRQCLSEGCDTSPALLCADGCSMIDRRMVFMRDFIPSASTFLMKGEHLIVKNFLVETAHLQMKKMVDLVKLGQSVLPASFKVLNSFAGCGFFPSWLSMDKFSMTDRRIALDFIDQSGPSNNAVISLDGLPEFIGSYLMGIGRLRWWCETNGFRVDLSKKVKSNMVVFTTPPGGTFSFTIEYRGRSITLSLYGRNLYVMGFRGPHGTFEFWARNEDKKKNYMSDEKTIILPFKKNYWFLAPEHEVGNVKLGLCALILAFESLYKCRGESKTVREAVASFAVHLAEAGRLQSVLKDVCSNSLDWSMDKLNSRPDNSFWIKDYSHYGGEEMKVIDSWILGKRPPGIRNQGTAQITEAQILNEIRILPRDGWDEGFFKHEPVPLEPSENDSVLEAYHSWLRTPQGMQSYQGRLIRSKQNKRKGSQLEEVPMVGDGRSSASFPQYLLEDWCLQEEEEDQDDDDDDDDDDKPMCGSNQDEELLEDIEKCDEKMRGLWKSSFTDTSMEEFLNHFPAVRKRLMAFNTKGQKQLQVPLRSIERVPCLSVNAFSARQAPMDMKESVFQYAKMRMQLGTTGRNLLRPIHPMQRNLLFRAGRVICRSFRFAL